MDKKLLKKIKVILLALLFLSLISSSFLAGKVFAADAVPPPGRIPCTDSTSPSNPEFSSDRPYQASPCGDRPISYWCGNDVVINLGTVKVPYCDKATGQLTECPCTGSQCDRNQNITVDLSDVQLPILGNTQLTKNSQSSADQIDDGTKASNYVAWYLGGTNAKAEYGYTDPTTAEGLSKIIDTSGPLKKLLPSIIQDANRLTTISSASQPTTYSTDTENQANTTPQQISENQNHNQIVLCANPDSSGLWSLVQNITGLGKFNPTECYPNGNNQKAQGGLIMRLKDWDGSLGTNVVINTIIQGAINGLKLIYPFIPSGVIETSIGQHWTLARPPLPWSNETGQPFKTDAQYQKAYQEWKGNICAIVPIINQVVCFANIFVPTRYADFYQYVPLANTVDKKGSHMIANTHITAPRATLENVSYVINHSPVLFLPHSLEDYQLSTQLMSTYQPAGSADPNADPTANIPSDVEKNTQCRIVPSRTNPGDDVTFGNTPSVIDVDVHYTVTVVQCTTPQLYCPGEGKSDYTGKTRNPGCYYTADCSSDVYATVNTIGKFAYNNEIWSNTVAGNNSIFRRIYPKTGAGSPVSCIADTPGSSNATYTLSAGSQAQGEELVRVQEPDKSNVPSDDGIVANAQLYYPHLGGVLDYFLNGIQQALLPQGYGPGQPTNGQYCTNIQCGDLPNLPKGSGACSLGSTSGLNVPNSLKQILEAAGQTYSVPPSLILGVLFGEGAFNPKSYNWTDQNVKNWASCVPLPNCSPSGNVIKSVVEFQSGIWANLAKEILPDLQKLDPTKTQADPCNLLDAVYGLAKDLHDNAGGYGAAGRSCFGVVMSSTNPTNCAWNNSQYVTSVKEWETGGNPTCYSRVGSCLLGNSIPPCPLDSTGPNCDTFQNHSSDTSVNSHMACIFDIATSGGSGNKR